MGSCCSAFGEEFQIRKLGLGHPSPESFTESRCIPLFLFALYRLIFAGVFVTALVHTGLEHPEGDWIRYLNNWNLVFVSLHFLVGGISSMHWLCCGRRSKRKTEYMPLEGTKARQSRTGVDYTEYTYSYSDGLNKKEEQTQIVLEPNYLSWGHEVSWLLYNLAANNSLVLTAAYYGLFFTVKPIELHFIIEILRHSLYTFMMIFDTLFSRVPVRVFHFVYSYMFGAAYVSFVLLYIHTEKQDEQGNPLSYPSLDYTSRPLWYTVWLAVIMVGGQPISQFFFWLVYKFRECCCSCCRKEE